MACIFILEIKETKIKTTQIAQPLNPELGFKPGSYESKSTVLCRDQIENFFLREPLKPFEQRVIYMMNGKRE